MDTYLFIICIEGMPYMSQKNVCSDGVIACAQRFLDNRLAYLMDLFSLDPCGICCEVWQYITRDEMKKLITVF